MAKNYGLQSASDWQSNYDPDEFQSIRVGDTQVNASSFYGNAAGSGVPGDGPHLFGVGGLGGRIAAEAAGVAVSAPDHALQSVTNAASSDNTGSHETANPQSDITTFAFPNPETVTFAGSGMVFVNTYGAGVTDPFHTAIIYAENELQSHFTNSVTLRVSFDFGDAHGFLAYNSFFNTIRPNYTTLTNALSTHATTADDLAAVNALPTTAPGNAHSSSSTTGFLVAAGMARILGLAGASSSIDDALILGNGFTWNFDPNNRSAGGYDAIGAIEHEISEGGMGRVGGLGYQNNTWAPMDLFRFTSAGQRDYTGGQDGVTTYFSPNGVSPDLTHPYHNSINAQGTFDGADPADWQVGGDSFGFGSPGVPGLLSATDLRVMDILGWTPTPSAPVLAVTAFDANKAEGSSGGSTPFTFTVTRTGSTSGTSTVFWQVNSGSSPSADANDFSGATSGTLTFNTGDTSKTITVNVVADKITEATEFFNVGLANATGATIDQQHVSATGTIQNDDPPTHWMASIDMGPHPAGWLPTGIGDFNHDATSDLAWYNSTNGNVDVWKFTNGHWEGSLNVGSHPAGWQPAGIADFNLDGTSDIAWYNSGNGYVETWKLVNGQWAGNIDVGPHPLGWQPAGIGDFNHDGNSDILWFNPATRDVDIWKLVNGQWTGSVDTGQHPAGWNLAGIGDFNNDGTSDVLWYNPTSGNTEIWTISNGQWSGSVNLGSHPAGWQPAGVGDFNNDGTSDVLWFNPNNGNVEIWQITNGQWAGSVNVGYHPTGWQPAGLGDFNHDGTNDILWRNADTGHIENWLLSNA